MSDGEMNGKGLGFAAVGLILPALAAGWGVACAVSAPDSSATATARPGEALAAQASVAASETSWAAPSLSGAPIVAAIASASVPSASASAVADDAPPPPCPPDMVKVGTFCVDAYEDALATVGDDGVLVPHPYYERPEKGVDYHAVARGGEFPQGYISQVESAAACKASGKRLCTKKEWQRACKGKGWMTYPYAVHGVHGKCNSGKTHLLSQMFKNPPGGYQYEDHFNSPELNKTPGWLSRSGEYGDCKTELGVYDMVGNLHEWVSDHVTDELISSLDEDNVERHKQPWREGNGVFMGGFYSTTSELGPGCLYITVAHEPTYHDYSTGFRCCKAADLPKAAPAKPGAPKPSGKPAASAAPAAKP